MINVGVVGLGHVASHHIAAIEESRSFRLAAACDPNPDALRSLDPAVRAVSDIEALLAMSDVDVVVVASPNRLHLEHGIAVIEAGKWLVMEKPVAPTRAQFDTLSNALERRGGHCSVALHAAFGVEVDWFCQQREAGALAGFTISSMDAQFYDPYFVAGELEHRALSLSGSWMDSGINALSVMQRIAGLDGLELVDSRMTRVGCVPCTEVQGTVDLRYRTAGGMRAASIDTNWTIGRNKKMTSLTSTEPSRSIVLDHSEQSVVRRENGDEKVLFRCDNGKPRLTNHYIGVFRDLAEQVSRGKDNFDSCRKMHDILYTAEELRS